MSERVCVEKSECVFRLGEDCFINHTVCVFADVVFVCPHYKNLKILMALFVVLQKPHWQNLWKKLILSSFLKTLKPHQNEFGICARTPIQSSSSFHLRIPQKMPHESQIFTENLYF